MLWPKWSYSFQEGFCSWYFPFPKPPWKLKFYSNHPSDLTEQSLLPKFDPSLLHSHYTISLSVPKLLGLQSHIYMSDYYLLLLYISLFPSLDMLYWTSDIPPTQVCHIHHLLHLRKSQHHFSSCSGQKSWTLFSTSYPSVYSIASTQPDHFPPISTAPHSGQNHNITSWIVAISLNIRLLLSHSVVSSSLRPLWTV